MCANRFLKSSKRVSLNSLMGLESDGFLKNNFKFVRAGTTFDTGVEGDSMFRMISLYFFGVQTSSDKFSFSL